MLKRGLLLFFVLLIPFVSAVSVEKVEIQDKEVVITIQGKVSSQIEFFKEGLSKGTYKLCEDSICDFTTRKELRIRLSNTGINEIGDYVLRIQEIDSDGQAAVQSHNLKINSENLDVCTDGTLNNACSSNKPLFCDNGKLAEKCGKGTFTYYTNNLELGITTIHTTARCGDCPAGKTCQIDGDCIEVKKKEASEGINLAGAEKSCADIHGNPSGCVSYDNGLACNSCNLCEWFSGSKKCCSKGKVWYEKRHDCVTPQEADEEPPIVKLLNEIPQNVEPDSSFELDLAVNDISGVEDVNLNLGYFITIYPDRYEPPSGTQLASINTKYIASVDTSYLSSGSYSIYANVKDKKGNEKKELLGSFNIEETSLCREVYPGYNNLNDNRFNIVFVGLGYNNKKNFVEFAKMASDFSSDQKGLFNVEPFKSNKDRFNIWYVDYNGKISGDCGSTSTTVSVAGIKLFKYGGNCEKEIAKIGGSCAFNNKVYVGLVNDDFRSHAAYRTIAQVSAEDYNLPIDIFNNDDLLNSYCSAADLNNDGFVDPIDKYYDINNDGRIDSVEFEQDSYNQVYLRKNIETKKMVDDCIIRGYGRNLAWPWVWESIRLDESIYEGHQDWEWDNFVLVTVHEFGHTYASLGDEYLENNNRNRDEKNCVNWVWKTPGVNIRQQACLKTAQWKDMLGNGCGQNNVIDCVKNNNYEIYDPNTDSLISSQDPNLNWDNFDGENINNEIYCYSGCGYEFNKQRSAYNSIMRDSYTAKTYGLFNEKLICEQIKADTGKVGGYCTEKFGMN